MDTFDKIILLLNEQRKGQKELADYIGVSQQKFSDWKAGRNKSYIKHLSKIASYFNVSTDYLLGYADKKEKLAIDDSELIEIDLSPEEEEIILALRELSPEVRRAVLRAAGLPDGSKS